eukprot:scaffold62672_cov33-Phaeocystis_antarctica.AAC.1
MPQTTEGPFDDHRLRRAPIAAAAALAWLLLCPGRAQTPVGCWYLPEAQSAQAICSAVVAEAPAVMTPLGTRSQHQPLANRHGAPRSVRAALPLFPQHWGRFPQIHVETHTPRRADGILVGDHASSSHAFA